MAQTPTRKSGILYVPGIKGKVRVQLRELERRSLVVRRTDPQGRRPDIIVLRDLGDGEPYDDPTGKDGGYVTIHGAVISSANFRRWGAPEVAAYLCAMTADRFARNRHPQRKEPRHVGSATWFRQADWFNMENPLVSRPTRPRRLPVLHQDNRARTAKAQSRRTHRGPPNHLQPRDRATVQHRTAHGLLQPIQHTPRAPHRVRRLVPGARSAHDARTRQLRRFQPVQQLDHPHAEPVPPDRRACVVGRRLHGATPYRCALAQPDGPVRRVVWGRGTRRLGRAPTAGAGPRADEGQADTWSEAPAASATGSRSPVAEPAASMR